MSWLIFAFLTILSYSVFDFFVKLSSDKIHTGLGGLIINIVSALVLLAFTLFSKFKGENVLEAKPGGWLYSVLAGVTVGLATIFFLKMFSSGTNLSLGVPLVRVGMVVLASLLGIILLKEGFNLKYLAGFTLSLLGLYLLLTSK